ncbi:putative ammonium transporter 1 [Penaeus indicus]|uniref:putative ammonium transporter 1 n=1 Tax=Penaeus indicus TaxID=29960 RepID=UPI00300D3B6B
MQCGFAFLEAGAVRSKNTINILVKNMLDVFIGGISYWLVGYPLAFGEGNAFCGASYWASSGLPEDRLAHWFFHFVFSATAATIVSGAVAERCDLSAYVAYSVALTGIVYPIISHWAWAPGGWLLSLGYRDFAGSGVVHVTGGVAALVGAVMLGPRHAHFGTGRRVIRGHSLPLTAFGGFIILFGFLAFTCGSQGSITREGDAQVVGRVVFNTALSGCSGGVCALLLHRTGRRRSQAWSFLMALNGAMTGMVSSCAGCNALRPWASCLTGVAAGLVFFVGHHLLLRLNVDDPLDAVAVHLGGGLWGLAAAALLQDGGLFYGGSAGLLVWNLVGGLAIVGWSGGLSFLVFGALKRSGNLRVSLAVEVRGLDLAKHGEAAYPAEAWEESQYFCHISSGSDHRARPPPGYPKYPTFPPTRRPRAQSHDHYQRPQKDAHDAHGAHKEEDSSIRATDMKRRDSQGEYYEKIAKDGDAV